jgi:3D (Asp-Asp-Asp) domain-containing protein
MKRQDLTTVVSTGEPAKNGEFSYDVEPLSGDTTADMQMAAGVSASSNPNKAKLIEPPNPDGSGAPSPGGLASMTTDYEVAEIQATNDKSSPFQVPLFGMSCYFTTLEADWGIPPDACGRVRIGGVVYKGTVTDPYGFAGTYCAAFIAEVKLQGSGVLNNGTKIQYEPSTQQIHTTTKITGADGTEVVAGATVARDRTVIPKKGVHIAVNGVGASLLANDTGGAIVGYRLDLYNGAGKDVCAHYNNRMRIGACTPAQAATCPKSDLK